MRKMGVMRSLLFDLIIGREVGADGWCFRFLSTPLRQIATQWTLCHIYIPQDDECLMSHKLVFAINMENLPTYLHLFILYLLTSARLQISPTPAPCLCIEISAFPAIRHFNYRSTWLWKEGQKPCGYHVDTLVDVVWYEISDLGV